MRIPLAPRAICLLFLCSALAVIGFTGCGSIATQPLPSSQARLHPNPPKIYVAPFDTETARWLVGRQGNELQEFKRDFSLQFAHILQERLEKIAPTELRWVDLPDEGWLVTGEFKTVYQGSRFLRSVVGAGAGETTFQTTVYVYDLSQSKTQYILAFNTGVQQAGKGGGAGSGEQPAGLSALGDPLATGINAGAGLKLDSTRTAREIRNILMTYR